jgi:hypothetical protein
MSANLLAQALAYAATGWPVFPCKPNANTCPASPPARCPCKVPVIPSAHPKSDPARGTCTGECGRYGHGFHDATTEPDVIRAWWREYPGANVAIATGKPAPDVLDVDVKPGGSGFSALNRLKRAGLLTGAAALVRTRGGGLHVYYAGTAQGCHSLPRHYLDFKSAGGYVLAPPSRVHGQPYELLDHRAGTAALDWQAVRRLLDPPRRRPAARPARPGDGGLPPSVRRALDADAEDRSAALHRLVGACVHAGLDEAAIHQLAAGYQPALEKYGARLAAEVERSLRKIGAA